MMLSRLGFWALCWCRLWRYLVLLDLKGFVLHDHIGLKFVIGDVLYFLLVDSVFRVNLVYLFGTLGLLIDQVDNYCRFLALLVRCD